jgi:hypothetical protein
MNRRNTAMFAALALAFGILPSPNELARSEPRDEEDEPPRKVIKHGNPDVAAKYRAERLARKAEAFRKRNPHLTDEPTESSKP